MSLDGNQIGQAMSDAVDAVVQATAPKDLQAVNILKAMAVVLVDYLTGTDTSGFNPNGHTVDIAVEVTDVAAGTDTVTGTGTLT